MRDSRFFQNCGAFCFDLFMFSMKAKINYEIFTVNLLSKWQIDGEDFVIFCGLLRKNEPYHNFERNENRATGLSK